MTPEQLKEWRRNQGATQSDLAEALGLTRETIGRWETGKLPVPQWLAYALAGIDAEA